MRTIAVWNYRFQFGNVSFPRAEKFAIERFSLEMSRFHALAPKSLELHFFPSNAFMASARSFNTFNCMLQNEKFGITAFQFGNVSFPRVCAEKFGITAFQFSTLPDWPKSP